MCGAWRDGAAAHGVVFDDEPSGSRGAFGAVGRGARGVRRAFGAAGRRAFGGHPVVARLCRDAIQSARRRQNAREMRSWAFADSKISPWRAPRAAIRGKISPWRVPRQSTVAFFRLMRSRRGLGREKRRFAARYRRHASEMSWFWQDSRAMRPKSPANSRLGIHCAKILPRRPPFPVRDPRIMHGAQILPCPDGATPVRPRSAARKQ